MDDPELLSSREEIALVVGIISEKLEALKSNGCSRQHWQAMGAIVEELVAAQGIDDKARIESAIREADELAKRGVSALDIEYEVVELAERKSRIAEREQKRLVALELYISFDRVLSLIGAIAGVVKDHVADYPTQMAIANGIGKLIEGGEADTAPHSISRNWPWFQETEN